MQGSGLHCREESSYCGISIKILSLEVACFNSGFISMLHKPSHCSCSLSSDHCVTWHTIWWWCGGTMCWHALTLLFPFHSCVCYVCVIRVGPGPAARGAWEDSARDLDERTAGHQYSHTEPQQILLTQSHTGIWTEGSVYEGGEDVN